MQVDAILFDKDGTLIDFNATFDGATAKVLDHLSGGNQALKSSAAAAVLFDLETGQVRDNSMIVAGTSEDIAKALLAVFPGRDLGSFTCEIDMLYGEACLQTVTLLPGVNCALESLKNAGLTLGVATNDAQANACSQMKACGVAHYFKHYFGADSGHGAKPDPGMVLAFCNALSVTPKHVMMVGDSTHDLIAAKAAGGIACGVLTGPASADDLEPYADVLLKSAEDLPAFLATGTL